MQFSLKEVVWFKKGQEVADLLSIELNPQIEIEEKEAFTKVKGTLELFGEYRKQELETPFSLRDYSRTEMVEEVLEREDGTLEFTHYFLIDITIPQEKVSNVEDIAIFVDAFDYDVPKNNQLQIAADISIVGLNEEREDTQLLPKEHYQAIVDNVFKEIAFEGRKEVEGQGSEDKVDGDISPQEEVAVQEIEEELVQQEEIFAEKEPTPEEIAVPMEEEVSETDIQSEERAVTEDISVQTEIKVGISSQKQADHEEIPVQEQEEPTPRSENELSLTKLFGNTEETHKKVRMYIVQNGDTLEAIAEKYELPTQQIARRNQLDEFYVTEGQILYLPMKQS